MALILLRHTTPAVEPGTCYGRTDLDVSTTFGTEAETALNLLPPFDHIVSSPLRRCRKLADFIGERSSIPVNEDTRLAEMDFGSWENRLWSEISRAEIDQWASDFFNAHPHDGESVAMLKNRVSNALVDWNEPYASTLIVTHAGVIRAALAKGETAEHFNLEIDFGDFVTISAPQGVPDE